MASARELLDRSRDLQDSGQPKEALQASKDALAKFRAEKDQVGLAEALRCVLGGQIKLLEITPENAQQAVKDESARIKKASADGRMADATMNMAAAEVYLFRADSEKALKAAMDAASVLGKEENPRLESMAWQMVVTAQLMRTNGPKALIAANNALSSAQKSGDRHTEASSWLAVATARHVAGAEDAKEAAGRALGIFRELGNQSNEASALILTAQVELSRGDSQVALGSAQDALNIARSSKNGPQAASALEVIVEARLATGHQQEALAEAESALAGIDEDAAGQPEMGVASAMAALLLAHTACRGIDSAVSLVKDYIVKLRERGDQRGEVRMLHKLATMSSVPPEVMNSAQAALALAQKIGDASQEASIKTSLTDIWAARGKIEKAPNRKIAMKALNELVKALDNQDREKFDDAAKYLDGYYNALKQEDIETSLARVIQKDPETYLKFLQEHGHMLTDDKPAIVSGCKARPVMYEHLYYGFTAGGISYGPRYRVNDPTYKRFNSDTFTLGVVKLSDESDVWERELAYNPSMLDGLLQSSAAGSHPSVLY